MGLLARLPEAAPLTDQQRRFVDALLEGKTEKESLQIADYAQTTCAAAILRSKSVQIALRAGREAQIRGELASSALTALRDLIGPQTPAATRFQAVKWVLDYDKANDQAGDKPLAEMTEAELMAVIERTQAVIAEAQEGRMIDVTPHNGA